MIDGVESLATIAAIDKIDPYKRRSNPNRTLLAMGVSNIASSLAGGLTIIPGGVKSTANIMAGGKTQWANFYNACFLLGMLLFLRDIINLFPYPVLAAVLIFTGYKLCKPSIWIHMYKIGPEQLVVFSVTAVVTIFTDLLVGIFAGILQNILSQRGTLCPLKDSYNRIVHGLFPSVHFSKILFQKLNFKIASFMCMPKGPCVVLMCSLFQEPLSQFLQKRTRFGCTLAKAYV